MVRVRRINGRVGVPVVTVSKPAGLRQNFSVWRVRQNIIIFNMIAENRARYSSRESHRLNYIKGKKRGLIM